MARGDLCPTRSRRADGPTDHLWTSSKSVNGGPKIAMCSWCGRLAGGPRGEALDDAVAQSAEHGRARAAGSEEADS